MSPQVGNGFNRHYWARFEEFSRYLVKDWEDVFICTGPLWIPKLVTKPDNTRKYIVEYEVIGNPPNVAVPTHFYKIILAENGDKNQTENKTRAIGSFILPNNPINQDDPLENYLVQKETLERYAGVKFFPKLAEQEKLNNLCNVSKCLLPPPWKPASKDSTKIITNQIESFILDQSLQSFEFPATLSSAERAIAHKESQSRGLQHYTVGSNDERRVIIEKIRPE